LRRAALAIRTWGEVVGEGETIGRREREAVENGDWQLERKRWLDWGT
jgi:hypothetical protein